MFCGTGGVQKSNKSKQSCAAQPNTLIESGGHLPAGLPLGLVCPPKQFHKPPAAKMGGGDDDDEEGLAGSCWRFESVAPSR